jgi:dihydroflavonol-4-reductase
MKTVLVTGASSFLGYHVAKRLNEQGIRPRVLELAESKLEPLERLDVSRCEGHLDDPQALSAACDGVDTLLHLAFRVSVGGGAALLEEMRRINVAGTERLLDVAAAKGVATAVVAGSALAVGVNRKPEMLDENANWNEHAFELPYATLRREAEQKSLAKARAGFSVCAVCPAFTLGPDDPIGAPANTLIKALIDGKLRFTLPVGFGILDVRDFANATVLAAQRGRSGQRYLISGHNVTTNRLLGQAAAIAGVRAPRFEPPRFLLNAVVSVLGIVSRIRRKPAPITNEILDIVGRYAWYDTSRARTELGWEPRPLQQTLEDTIRWLRAEPKTKAAVVGP